MHSRTYAERGYDFPIRVIQPDQAAALHDRFLEYVAANSEQLDSLVSRDQYVAFSETMFPFAGCMTLFPTRTCLM